MLNLAYFEFKALVKDRDYVLCTLIRASCTTQQSNTLSKYVYHVKKYVSTPLSL